MNESARWVETGGRPGTQRRSSSRFPAQAGRFDGQEERVAIDGLAGWVEERYREDLARRPSKHVYVSTLPAPIVALIDRLRDSVAIRERIAAHFGPGWDIEPLKHTDELYLSHYNKDGGGDQGLFDRHYDGNLRFLPASAVVRALIYLQSDASYRVLFADSGLAKAFTTYEFGLLDFHRELHWVEGTFDPASRQRILLKCNYLVTRRGIPLARTAGWAANTGVFYVVKAAMEYSKSPRSVPQRLVGVLCNAFRSMNNVHPFVPFAFLLAVAAAAAWGVGGLAS
jgi:hypothetical protein